MTIAVAVAFVLAFQAEVAKPYRIPTSSMEPTLHCAKPGAFCEGRVSDRVIANRLTYRFRDPKRGEIVSSSLPPKRPRRCGGRDGGSTFVKRIVGLPRERVSERNGIIYINGERLIEAYVDPSRRGREKAAGGRLRLTTTSSWVTTACTRMRLPHLGNGAPKQPDRAGDAQILAAKALLVPLIPYP